MNRTIVITGASDGLGAAAAGRLTRSGENVVVVGRSPTKTAAVATPLGADYFVTDFADFAQVRELAANMLERYPRIDVLANNAGVTMGANREVTVDGHEKTFQVNHLAPFLLTTLLLDRLIDSRASVINTSSFANRFSAIDFDDLDALGTYRGPIAYCRSKLMNILVHQGTAPALPRGRNRHGRFSSRPGGVQLQRRFGPEGLRVDVPDPTEARAC